MTLIKRGVNTMKTLKARRWFIKFPSDAYALGPVSFQKPVTESTVRQYAREFDGLKRLPVNFACWPAGE